MAVMLVDWLGKVGKVVRVERRREELWWWEMVEEVFVVVAREMVKGLFVVVGGKVGWAGG